MHTQYPSEKPNDSQHKIQGQPYDDLLITLSDYVHDTSGNSTNNKPFSDLAYQTAHLSLLDSFACLLLAQQEPQCIQLLGPIIPGTLVPLGSRVPGTPFELDPIKAAFDIGTCIRWLDYNDTWLAAEWGHPSDNLGGILAIADYLSRCSSRSSVCSLLGIIPKPMTIKDILTAMIQAYEIQGILALDNAFNRVGLDHVVLVKVATTAVVSQLLGLSKHQTLDALSNAWIDGQSLRTYRHAPNTGARKSWAAGDATSRGLRLAWMVMQGQQGYPSALSAKRWGFNDVLFQGKALQLSRPLDSYVMENVLFKVAFPAEFHAQTAVEAAIQLHPQLKDKLSDIDTIEIETQEPVIRIIHKEGPLYNYADRDHCLQYMVAIGLLLGDLKAEHYSDTFAKDPRIDTLRAKMKVVENKKFSQDYLDPLLRAIPNAIQVFFRDGTTTERVQIDFPLGHKQRRIQAYPKLKDKYNRAIEARYSSEHAEKLKWFWDNPQELLEWTVDSFMSAWEVRV